MTVLHSPAPPGLEPDVQSRSDRLYKHALWLAFWPTRRGTRSHVIFNLLYWLVILAGMSWLFSMTIDRTPPVDIGPRVVVNDEGRVAQGEQLLIRSSRRRHRTCELVRRISVVDGHGRRHDFEPEPFDAYGPVTPKGGPDEVETTGPYIPRDAAPGRARSFAVLAWDCNPLQRMLGWSIVTVLPAVEFEIVVSRAPR